MRAVLRLTCEGAKLPRSDGNRSAGANDNRASDWIPLGKAVQSAMTRIGAAAGLSEGPDFEFQDPDAGRLLGDALGSGSSLKIALRKERLAPEDGN